MSKLIRIAVLACALAALAFPSAAAAKASWGDPFVDHQVDSGIHCCGAGR